MSPSLSSVGIRQKIVERTNFLLGKSRSVNFKTSWREKQFSLLARSTECTISMIIRGVSIIGFSVHLFVCLFIVQKENSVFSYFQIFTYIFFPFLSKRNKFLKISFFRMDENFCCHSHFYVLIFTQQIIIIICSKEFL